MSDIPAETEALIAAALAEDAAANDLTAHATIAAEAQGEAVIIAKADGILSGTAVAEAVFRRVDANIQCAWPQHDGSPLRQGEQVGRIHGSLRALLAAERTALNFLQHLSGIATATHHFCQAVAGSGCSVVDTRKTTPGLRRLEKQAVHDGGGVNHRLDLASGMLIKENHIEGCGSIVAAVRACQQLAEAQDAPVWVEVECETLAEVERVVPLAPDLILLDNMTPAQVRAARAIVPTSITLEASGNITLTNARAYAETGVDRIAIGAITHSAPALDLSMRIKQRDQA